ncbi:MAG: hypothetical protein EA403_13950 [Spirochaetaceae bacterium]|nr:MAG: hypothetical protein EA403_13950 [Spirochaetaceae bacterium]
MDRIELASGALRGLRVLITARSFGRNDPNHLSLLSDYGIDLCEYREEGPLDLDRLTDMVKNVDGWVVSVAPVNRAILEQAKRLKIVVKHGVGTDNIDIQAADELGIMVANAPGSNHIPVAELAVGMMLCLSRMIHRAHNSVVSGEWKRFLGTGLSKKRIGIIGLGRIGIAIAERVRAFDAQVLGFDPFLDQQQRDALPFITWHDNLGKMLDNCDLLSVNVPLTDSTTRLIDHEALSHLPAGALVINTARGRVVDETAVFDALQSGHLGGYATDVFEKEPPTGSPLLGLDRVLFTPHVASYTVDAMKSLGDDVISNLVAGLCGETPGNRITAEGCRDIIASSSR